MLSDDEIMGIAKRCGLGYCRKRTHLDKDDVIQEATAIAYEQLKKLRDKIESAADPKSFLGYIILKRLQDWERQKGEFFKYLWKDNKRYGTFNTTYVSFDSLPLTLVEESTWLAVEDKGYWFIEELSAYQRTRSYYQIQKKRAESKPELTPREHYILILIAEGYTVPKIAKILHTSKNTVITQTASLRMRLRVTNQTQAVRRGFELGYLN
jgi:DNA-binding CsgD family transcriptional regulator